MRCFLDCKWHFLKRMKHFSRESHTDFIYLKVKLKLTISEPEIVSFTLTRNVYLLDTPSIMNEERQVFYQRSLLHHQTTYGCFL